MFLSGDPITLLTAGVIIARGLANCMIPGKLLTPLIFDTTGFENLAIS
jgi:hypothetical protein